MNLLKNKKKLIVVVLVFVYLLLSFIVAFSAFSIDDEILKGTPRDLGINYQEIKIETENSYISSWWIPADSETTIILLHGLRGQKADPEILKKIELFHNNGLSLIAIDFRNHGSSGEGDFTFGIDEVNDVYATVDYFHKNEGINSYGLWGFSYGATTALLFGLEFEKQIDEIELIGIFAESPYLDLLEVFTDQVAYRTPLNNTMANLLKPGTIFLTNLIYDFDFNSIKNTFGTNREIDSPTKVISCFNDEIVPISQSKEISEILGFNSHYEEFEECNGHGYVQKSDPERYKNILQELFK